MNGLDSAAAAATVAVPAVAIPTLTVYLLTQLLIIVYSSHRYLVLWRWWRLRDVPRALRPAAPGLWPHVTVQLPVFNEPEVVQRLIDAVARFEYPPDRLEIQVLDDSTDATTVIARAAAAGHRARGIDIAVHHRGTRRGFKAGALAEGLRHARGEFIAVFDADFVPPPDFLERMLPHFTHSDVGMVQARWGHLNRDRSLFTEAQAVMLDAHFVLEHEVRMRYGLFFNFNGTAGIWRRECIEDAGGWSADTLTEDLDLSYRAQLAGWRFVFEPDVVCPGELPGDIEALKSQQRRWTQGAIQTAVKMLPRVWASTASRAAKIEAVFHLTCNLTYPLLLALIALTLPVMLSAPPTRSWLGTLVQFAVIACGVVPVMLFLVVGQWAAGGRGAWQIARGTFAAMVLGMGLSVNNARAAMRGFGRVPGDWERTPKTGDQMSRPALARRPAPARSGWIEVGLACYCASLALIAESIGHVRALPFILLLVIAFWSVGWASRRAAASR